MNFNYEITEKVWKIAQGPESIIIWSQIINSGNSINSGSTP